MLLKTTSNNTPIFIAEKEWNDMNIIGHSGKGKKLGTLGALLLLSFGAATPAYASSPSGTKDGCTVTFQAPIPVTSSSPKLIDYPVTARCGPNMTVDVKQRWAEDDTGIGDRNEEGPWKFASRSFTKSSTIVLHFYANLPDTEGGPEEMFNEGTFRVRAGAFIGDWYTPMLQSRNVSISN